MIRETVSWGCADSRSLWRGPSVKLLHLRRLGTPATKRQLDPAGPRTARLRHLSYVVAVSQECKPWNRWLFIVKVSAAGSGATGGNPEKCWFLGARSHHSTFISTAVLYQSPVCLHNPIQSLDFITLGSTGICNLYQFGFQKVLLINFGFYCVSPLKAQTVKLNIIAFDMGNG